MTKIKNIFLFTSLSITIALLFLVDKVSAVQSYSPYCGDGLVNQSWEQCDGQSYCTSFCQFNSQCIAGVFARINVINVENWNGGDMTSDIFLGSASNRIPQGKWFPLYVNGSYIDDSDIGNYEVVPGLAVQRQGSNKKLRVRLHGSHTEASGTKEHIQGYIEFINASVLTQESDNSGNNKLENPFDNIKEKEPTQDEVWISDNKSMFWLTVTTQDDSFYTNYGNVNICTNKPKCSDSIDNDGDGKKDIQDPACHTDGNPNNTNSYNPDIDSENEKPVITLLGNNPIEILQGSNFTDPGATANDPEDGDITYKITVSGFVNTSVPGQYTLTYNVADSKGLAADPVQRTVIVKQISNPVNHKPTITLLGANPITILQGNSFIDPGATAYDIEDGDITYKITVSGFVNTSVPGQYTLTYNVADSKGLAADPVQRTVIVKEKQSLEIFNEKVEETEEKGKVRITWETNLPSTSRVVYDILSHSQPEGGYLYGYRWSSAKDENLVLRHSVFISGLVDGVTYYFRVVSGNDSLREKVGKELSIKLIPDRPNECNYLLEYIQLGANNNPKEVLKLKVFLNVFEKENLQLNGIYDIAAFEAVKRFQAKYLNDIITPWGHESPTGYVYILTKKKINEIYCQKAFPLTPAQEKEIEEFRSFIEGLRKANVFGKNGNNEDNLSGASQEVNNVPQEIASSTSEKTAVDEGGSKNMQENKQFEKDSKNKSLFASLINVIDEQWGGLGNVFLLFIIILIVVAFIYFRRNSENR
ncbi:hypothetical protein HRbin34_00194 [bacterium HR34]|nr:hypothetical protein HRbin34_00194 [bacterium HR34]